MANTIRDYSATAASNTAVDGADISEGCSPAGINDAIRGVMADLKDVSTGAVSLESPAADSLSLSGALTTTSTIDGRDVAADGTKLDGIAAGANNYVHPNHTGEVTSTGDGALTIADNIVDEANLKVSNTPTDGYVLTAQSGNTGGLTWAAAASGGGADLYAANESSPTAQPSATGANAVAIGDSAVAAGADSVALGEGAVTVYGKSTAIGIGMATAPYSCAINIVNNTSSYGTIGDYSFAQGDRAKAQGYYSIALGRQTLAQSNYSVAIGYDAKAQANNSISIGTDTKVTAQYGIALGTSAESNVKAKLVVGSGSLNTYLYAQTGILVLSGRTANATTGALCSDAGTTSMGTASSDNQLFVPSYGAIAFDGMIVARGQGSASDTNSAAFKVEGLIRRESAANTTTLVNSAITVISNAPSWGLSLSADTTNGCLSVNVTGASAANVKWVCTLRSSETLYNAT